MDDTKSEQQVVMSLNDMEGINKFIEDNLDEQTVIRITIET